MRWVWNDQARAVTIAKYGYEQVGAIAKLSLPGVTWKRVGKLGRLQAFTAVEWQRVGRAWALRVFGYPLVRKLDGTALEWRYEES